MDKERYIYYRDVLHYLEIILNKKHLTKDMKKLAEEEYEKLHRLREEDIKNHTKFKIKNIYKADIYEYDNGFIHVLYNCDKNKNTECDKKNCSTKYCTRTLSKKYAKNYYKDE